MSIWDAPIKAWAVINKVEELLLLNKKTDAALERLNDRLRRLEDRMTHLEAGQGQIITEARAAAGAAATGTASLMIADIVTRVTRIEMRQDDTTKRLPQ